MKGSEGSSEVKRVGKEVCQERRVLKKSGRSVSGLGLQSCQQEELSRQDSEMTRANRIKTKWHR